MYWVIEKEYVSPPLSLTMAGRPLTVDITGHRYGRLTVLERAPNKGRKVRWYCRCDCGSLCVSQTFDLIFGKTRSCGCLRNEVLSELREKRKIRQRRWHRMNPIPAPIAYGLADEMVNLAGTTIGTSHSYFDNYRDDLSDNHYTKRKYTL